MAKTGDEKFKFYQMKLGTQANGRLSLEAFKLKSLSADSKVVSLLGGMAEEEDTEEFAASCHQHTIADPGGITKKVKFDEA